MNKNFYDDKTEILTNKGFKLFPNLAHDDKIAQYHNDGSVNFIYPISIFSDNYNGDMFHFISCQRSYVDILVSPTQEMVTSHKKKEVLTFEAKENKYSDNYYAITCGKSIQNFKDFSDLDRLKIAFQADGSFASHKEDYDGSRAGGTPIRFSLKRDRKKKRLESILNSLNFKYTKAEEKGRDGYNRYWISGMNGFLKDFSWIDLDKISCEWGMQFLEELKYWDGSDYKNRNVFGYCSTNKKCIDKVQEIAAISGYKSHVSINIDKRKNRLPLFRIILSPNKQLICGSGINYKIEKYIGKVYSVLTETKKIILKSSNRTLVCSSN
jgi:hypothetical protein